MGKYLFEASYTQSGLQGLMKEGAASRKAFLEKMVSDLGGSIDTLSWAFGDVDFIAIAELPDDTTAAAVSLAVASAGVASIKTTVLIDEATMDAATKRDTGYRPPGV
jgi:uncharacterized protein with GYD domain